MKQLLIVNSQKALNAKSSTGEAVTPYNLSGLDKGAITFFELGGTALLSAAATKNFAIALGRGTNLQPFVIPEVDIDTLEIVKAKPKAGKPFKAVFTFPTPVEGKEYTVILIKKGTVPNERNMFTTSVVAKTTTASTEAAGLVKAITNKVNDMFPVKASNSGATVTIEGLTVGEQWEIKFADELSSVTPTTKQAAEPTIGDKAFILDLAQRCAADKGFNYLDQESRDIYPGFPEDVEDLVPNDNGTVGYALYSLHFATGRKSGKTTDERVWQYVHIAVPVTNASIETIDAILPEGVFSQVAAASAQQLAAKAQQVVTK